jgi:HD-GYP domain-containing protein (c-di-GMP phosphodiesterase class II)
VKELSQVAAIIRHHHENIDGSGYPDGLRGDAIPYLARILAVADAYEALTSDRSYRKALPREQAFQSLRADSGHRFDPAVVEMLIAVESAPEGEIWAWPQGPAANA